MSDLRRFIERVLAKRLAQQPRLEAVEQGLRDLGRELARLHRLASETSASDDAPPEMRRGAATLAGLVDGLDGQVNDALARAANLLARFRKRTINVGVSGKTGMGKSTLLQAISGLDDGVIPTSPGKPCTGAKSTILHQEDDAHAVIEFYGEAEFLREIVHAYYADLRLPDPPASLADFARSLPPKPPSEAPGSFAVYDKLRELHRAVPHFGPFLSRPPQRVGLHEVRQYVAQDDGRCLAVRCANIRVRFPHGDVTGLGLIDLPGLGEVAKGHGQKLVASLQQDVDAVIVLKRPLPGRALYDEEDYKGFDRIQQASPEVDLADWLFVVLNEDAHNAGQVEILRNDPPRIGCSPRVLSADCRCREQVGARVFAEVLRHLEANLERIDERRGADLTGRLSRVAGEACALVRPVQDYFQTAAGGAGDYEEFRVRFDVFWRAFTTNLNELTEDYRQRVRDRDLARRFAEAVNEACDAAQEDVPVPSLEDLKGRFHAAGGWNGVVEEELHHLRSFLTRCLADALDRRLGQMIEEVRGKVVGRLVGDPLARLLPPAARDQPDPGLRLGAFRCLLDPGTQPAILAGIDYLSSFSFSYQSHFHYRVREAMDPLDPMAVRDEGEDDPVHVLSPPGASAGNAGDVARGLRAYYERVVWDVRKRLLREENDPLRAVYAMVEETRDRLARARGVERQWERLLYPRRAEVWPEAFNRFAVESLLREQWRESIEATERCADRLRPAPA